ncbi:MAG: hypothetical protein MOGMAGMI_00604 [Candidatus Omnitrophica bacterium]|nr:hypothetical protein [Candidatus Omnitrophota bacterium]
MISEKVLADKFNHIWASVFPMLDATFMRTFNIKNAQRIRVGKRGLVPPVHRATNVERYDLVAELAFEGACDHFVGTVGGRARALVRYAKMHQQVIADEVTTAESEEASKLLSVYEKFFKAVIGKAGFKFHPFIPGTSVLDNMVADICTDMMLIEVKAVSRNLSSTDIKQMLCYLIAGQASGRYHWRQFCFFNPRRAIYYMGDSDWLISALSGKSTLDVVTQFKCALAEVEYPILSLHSINRSTALTAHETKSAGT